MSRNTGSVASSDSSWLKLYAAVAVLPLTLAACGGGGGGGGSPAPSPTPTPAPAPAPTPAPTPAPAPTGPGLTWNTVAVTAAGNMQAVDYADGRFVAVTDTGNAIGSADAATWAAVTPLTSSVGTDHLDAYAIAHLGTTFAAVGSVSSSPYTTFTGAAAYSGDGLTWTPATLPAGATPLHGVFASTTKLVGLGETGHLYASTDGHTWTALQTLPTGVGTLNGGAFGNNTYVAVGDGGYVAVSANGNTWESGLVFMANSAGINMHGVAWTGSLFVAVGDGGAISTSTNGANWSGLRNSAFSGTLRSVAVSSNGLIVVVGDNGIETSTDGVTWTARNDSGVAALAGVTFGNSEFVAVGAANAMKVSTN